MRVLSLLYEVIVVKETLMMIKTYSELMSLNTFLERYRYLRIGGTIGRETFGRDRYLNQILYRSDEWKFCRRDIFIRDRGCDLGIEGFDIHGTYLVHHIDPITVEDVLNRHPKVFDPENLITTVLNTHNAIHYGDESLLILPPIERTRNDTCPWRQ